MIPVMIAVANLVNWAISINRIAMTTGDVAVFILMLVYAIVLIVIVLIVNAAAVVIVVKTKIVNISKKKQINNYKINP